MDTLDVRLRGTQPVGSFELDLKVATGGPGPHDLDLLLEQGAEIDRDRVERHLAGLDPGQVEQFLCHPENALRLLVDDLRGTGPGLRRLQATVDEGLAEADQARERGLELVGDVGEKFALQPARPVNRLGHPVEGPADDADLVLAVDAHPARVVAGGDVLGRGRQLGERPGERTAQEEGQREGQGEGDQPRFEEEWQELVEGERVDRGGGTDQHQAVRTERVAAAAEGGAGADVGLATDVQRALGRDRLVNPAGPSQLDLEPVGGAVGGVEDDRVLGCDQEHPVGEAGNQRVHPLLEDVAGGDAAAGAGGRVRRRGGGAFGPDHLSLGGKHLPVEVDLRIVELERANQNQGEESARQQAHPDDSRRCQQQAVAEAQAAFSSSRYPTPHTVSMEGSLTPAAASFSRTCWTWTSTVRV